MVRRWTIALTQHIVWLVVAGGHSHGRRHLRRHRSPPQAGTGTLNSQVLPTFRAISGELLNCSMYRGDDEIAHPLLLGLESLRKPLAFE